MELLNAPLDRGPVRAVLFDFDGTISTLRHGWEAVMKPLMLEVLSPAGGPFEEMVDRYIDESTGIQTIAQMKWLSETVRRLGLRAEDPWHYKAEYNRRLMETVGARLRSLESGVLNREDFLIAGSEAFLQSLHDRGVRLYVASGTDHPDVVREVAALGLEGYFDLVAGAPTGSENCSKEAVIGRLLRDEGLTGGDFAVIGDGKVEIRLGREACARTVGLATDEARRSGVDPVKRERLIKAGADAIAGDFLDLRALLDFLGLR